MKDLAGMSARTHAVLEPSSWRAALAASVGLLLATLVFLAPVAQASLGYEPDPSTPTIAVAGEQPHGVAIDQSTQLIYVAIPSTEVLASAAGQIDQLQSNGTPTAASPFTPMLQPLFSGVAVNPVTHGIYAAAFVTAPQAGGVGVSRVDQFSSSGVRGTQFSTENPDGVLPQVATDSSGNLYYPNAKAKTIQVFNSAGVVQETISCAGCPGGKFETPNGVAIDSAGNLYVVDLEKDQLIKFTNPGSGYTFNSVLQSGRHVVAVGVDPSSDNSVFVGDYSGGSDYHVVAYSSSGVQFDDFGAGMFAGSTFGPGGAGQIAVNATTHKVYVSDPDANLLRVFSRVTINPPTATTNPATSVGQVSTKFNATVNAHLHATIDCHFEYVKDVDFQGSGYSSASVAPCTSLPSGSNDTPVQATVGTLSPSTTYHYRIAAANNGGSVSGSDSTFTTLPLTPSTVTTGAASGVAQTIATLAGKVNPHGGLVSDCHFEYGIGLSYANSIPCPEKVGAVTTDVGQSVKVTGLTARTNYHYRLVVTSNAGQVNGGDSEFTTLPPAPTVTTDAASAITQTSATIAGGINPNGGAATCHFEYGPTIAYGSTAACSADPGAGEGVVAEHADLSGLVPGTAYHYRLVGANAGGTVNGSDQTAVTQAATLPVAPPPLTTTPVATPPKALKCKRGFQKKKVRGKLKCVKKKKRRHR